MTNNRAVFKAGYHKLLEVLQRSWRQQDVKNIEQLIKNGMQAYRFNNEISPAQLTEIEMQLKADLYAYAKMISQPTPSEPQRLAIEDTLWSWLVAITDKSQLEWLELPQDFEHKGVYHSGEIVGLGEFVCKQCSQQQSIYHPQEIGQCVECNGELFSRAPFNP